ncbi:MAG: pyruvate kinase [Desulfohalobiaceae bacterium]
MRIKTIATLGPSSSDQETIKDMALHGVRIFRLNFSHADAQAFLPTVESIRGLEQKLQLPLTIMGDLSGPKIRIGNIPGSPVQVSKGDKIYLGLPDLKDKHQDRLFISLDQPQALKNLGLDMPVTLSDGVPRFQVRKILEKDRLFLLEAINGGILSSHKGITFPGKKIRLPAFTSKDKENLHQGLDIGLDCFALSFVQDKKDIEEVQAELQKHGSWAPIIAKLERANAVENLDQILSVADGVMVARGDLGLECELPSLPVLQKKIIRACRHVQKPAIVATQMLLSMVNNPLPTRAETTDVANAILDGADCVMLSEETAVGSYPVEAVGFIQEIAWHAEAYLLERMQGPYRPKQEKNPAKYLAYSACLVAENTESAALACHSTTGATARLLSSRRPAQPIYALTPDIRVIRFLNFFWGILPRTSDESKTNHLQRVEDFVQESKFFQPGQSVVITSGQPTPGQKERHTNQIKVYYK